MGKKLIKQNKFVDGVFTRKPSRKIHAGEPSVNTTRSGIKWVPSEVRVGNRTFYTNIKTSDRELDEMYELNFDSSNNVHAEHQHLLLQFNDALWKKVPNASVVVAGINSDSSCYYVEYHGRPETEHGGMGNTIRKKRIAKIVAEIASQYPYIIEPSIGDISGEGDYTTHLIVWRE